MLTIGQVADRTCRNASAIRYYERIGVLPEPKRQAGQRRYTEATVRRLEVIDVAKRAGFTLDDARSLLTAGEQGTPARDQIRALAQRRLGEVDALIDRAKAMKRWLIVASDCECATLEACCLFEGPQPSSGTGANR